MKILSVRPLRTVLIAGVAAGGLVLTACAPDSANSRSSSSTSSAASSATSSASSAATDASSAASSDATTGGGAASEADIAAATAALIKPGTLTVCTHLPYAPFQSNDDSGKTVGFDVDIVQLIADSLGVEQAIVDTPFEGIRTGQDMSTGKCDIAAAGMTITPEREAVITFSVPYFDATQALLVRESDSITSLADLNGKVLGAQSSTTGLTYAQAHAAEFGYEIKEYNDLASQQQGLTSNSIDGAINDLPVWSEFIKETPGVAKIAEQFDTGEQYGLGMKLGNTALKAVADSAIETAKSDGTYDEIYTKWIGEVPAA